ncbi:ABC transporter ATP-binding protein [Gryllotalpicola sp.]|uniref:ABC transporter ATP-binding protein n=1 Tax=Gryllotalpicola sp. TaxID=1932787 RepID=UPI00260A5D14|nr:ABC transporter ATP-binding protein [Gryllotalpicola sp.]
MSSSERRPVVIVDDVHVRYKVYATGRRVGRRVGRFERGIKEVHALRGVSFTVYEGENIGVIGHNGSGKSTLLRTVAGFTPASEGAVYATSQPSLLGVGSALLPRLDGHKNINLGALALGMTPAEAEASYDYIAEFSGLKEHLNYPMRTYSSGMSARLKFSIAMAKAHQILLVDEALAVGDKAFRDRSEKRIRELREEAGTTFLVSHSMQSILDTCDRAIWIDHGELRLDGDPQTVVDAYEASTADL